MLTIIAALALQAPVLVESQSSSSDRIRFVFASDMRDTAAPAEPVADGVAFTPRAYHDIVKQCGGKRLSAWQWGSRIVVSGIGGPGNAELASCVEASANRLRRVEVRGAVGGAPQPDYVGVQPLVQSPTRVR